MLDFSFREWFFRILVRRTLVLNVQPRFSRFFPVFLFCVDFLQTPAYALSHGLGPRQRLTAEVTNQSTGATPWEATSAFDRVIFGLATALPMVLFLAPVSVFRTGEPIHMPPLQLTLQTTQCFLFLLYSIIYQNTAGIIANAGGLFFGLVFVILYPLFWHADGIGLFGTFKTDYTIQVLLLAATCVIVLWGYARGVSLNGESRWASAPNVDGTYQGVDEGCM